MLASQVLKAANTSAHVSLQEVQSVKCTFGVAMSIAVFGGLLSLLVGYVMGILTTEISDHLYQATDQALAFQTAESQFRGIAAV